MIYGAHCTILNTVYMPKQPTLWTLQTGLTKSTTHYELHTIYYMQQYFAVLNCIVLYCTLLKTFSSTVQCGAVQWSAVQCSAVQCSES